MEQHRVTRRTIFAGIALILGGLVTRPAVALNPQPEPPSRVHPSIPALAENGGKPAPSAVVQRPDVTERQPQARPRASEPCRPTRLSPRHARKASRDFVAVTNKPTAGKFIFWRF